MRFCDCTCNLGGKCGVLAALGVYGVGGGGAGFIMSFVGLGWDVVDIEDDCEAVECG